MLVENESHLNKENFFCLNRKFLFSGDNPKRIEFLFSKTKKEKVSIFRGQPKKDRVSIFDRPKMEEFLFSGTEGVYCS